MNFVKFMGAVYAFHADDHAQLARYMVANPDKVQCLSNRAVISCNQTYTTRIIVMGAGLIPMMELQTNRDIKSLWNLSRSIRQYKELTHGA